MNVKESIKNEFSGWKNWEMCWLVIAIVVIGIVSIYMEGSLIGFITAETGIIAVITGGKGKTSTYVFGLINTIFLTFIAFEARYYGRVMLNICYYLPMFFYGMYVWSRNINPETKEVYKNNLSLKNSILLVISVFAVTFAYGIVLQYLNGNMPFVDSLATVVAIVAFFLGVMMYSEQWLLWIIENTVSVIMWIYTIGQVNGGITMFVMASIYLINSIVMYIKWRRDAEKYDVE